MLMDEPVNNWNLYTVIRSDSLNTHVLIHVNAAKAMAVQCFRLREQAHPQKGETIMRLHPLHLLPIATALALTASAAWAQDATAGHAVFTSQCSACHSVDAGRTILGPSLAGIVGRPAGQEKGFHYSAANKASGLTWDEPTLERYLTKPQSVVPHTTMGYPGEADPKKRADLIAYLATLH